MKLLPIQREALEKIASGDFVPCLVREVDGWHARWRAAFGKDNPWIDRIVRESNIMPSTANWEQGSHPTLHDAFIGALKSRSGLVKWADAKECERFAGELELWSRPARVDPASFASLVFKFSALPGEDGASAIEVDFKCGDYFALGRAIEIFTPLKSLARIKGSVLRAMLEANETESFLRTGARALAAAGFGVEGVDLAAGVTIDGDIAEIAGEKDKAKIKLTVRVAGEAVGAREIKFLLDQGSPFVFFRGRWIEVDRSILKNALKALEKSGSTVDRMRAIRFAQGLGSASGIPVEKLKAGGWLRGLIARMSRGSAGSPIPALPAPKGLKGELRGYQTRGTEWMKFLVENGFGALLADDMGLGKTIETIALILSLGKKAGPCLVVAPLSLLANWRHEIAAFAPSLKVYVHHGDARAGEIGFAEEAGKADVTLTSYALLVKDYSAISSVAWGMAVVDEAQWIKNADTRAAKALKALGVLRRIALTGTPVENSANDVWSIEDFLNPGFLPERKEFVESYAKPISADAHSAAAKRLRHALEPFVLRRLKTDKAIAAELGEKREIREFCSLTLRDRAKYEAALDIWKHSEHTRGDILALLTRLKLVCDGEGKFARLVDLVDGIVESGESVLVFTQYAKVAVSLKAKLEKRYPSRVALLHGGLSAKEREAEIARFNSEGPAVFILSLKAGGFGLNLVKATHVVHFDRWWNPAVEAQATDRAHRIGQRRTVFVHLMVSEGTLEERIDAMLEKKLAVSGGLIGDGERFLASLTRREIDKVVALD